MSVLVTGAAGFIGSHVTDRLLDRGEEVVGVDSFDDFYARETKERNLRGAREQDGFTLVEADIRDPDFGERIPDGLDAVIHLAARAGVRPSIRQPAFYTSVNVDGTVNLLELARERGIGALLFASSSSVYGNTDEVPFREDARIDRPISPYAATKAAGEVLCHTWHHLHGIGCLCLRFFTVYGPRQRPDLAIHKFARLLDAGEPIPMYGDGTTERDYTFVEDILQGVEGALRFARENPGRFEIVNLGESRTVPLREMIRVVGEAMGVEPEIERHPMQPGDVERTYADVSKARALFGYDPRFDFEEGVRIFVEWFQEMRGARPD